MDNSIITRYDDMLYDSRPTALNEFLSNKYNKVHDELYNSALNRYIHNIIDKYVTSNMIYELYCLISNLASNDDENIMFENIYDGILSNKDKTPITNYVLNELSIDRRTFLKIFYDITCTKLVETKKTLLNFYKDDNGNLESIFEQFTQLSDIRDFRFVYISLISSEDDPNEGYIYSAYRYDDDNVVVRESVKIASQSDTEYSLFLNEDNDYIFLFDFDGKIRIGYDKDGKWILILNGNKLKNINNLENIVNDFMEYESKNIINLYKDKICDLYKRYHKIIEIKSSEYWMPSMIRIINKIPPYKKNNISLKKYWNMNQKNSVCDISKIKITNENINDTELIELNYVSGKAKLHSRSTDLIYDVPFKYLKDNTNISNDMILSDTFISKYNAL